RPWAERQRPPLMAEALHRVKDTFDPRAVLNPGVLLAPRRPGRGGDED
ncbi:MAG: FAD-linked oxidase C-terminal domain-containing protein, partial [Acidobacteriota bacterium]